MVVMALTKILLLASVAAATSIGDDKIDCSQIPLILCSADCSPICAGNDDHQETFTNYCLYRVEYCSRNLSKANYKIKDYHNACPIDCSYKTSCFTDDRDSICVKRAGKPQQQTFTNYCTFRSAYCELLSKNPALGTNYCITKGECVRGNQ